MTGSGCNDANERAAAAKSAAVAMDKMDITTITPTVDIYPYHTNPQDLLLNKSYKKTKVVHFIRHAQGTHNVDKNYRCITNLDARLTKLGKEQSQALANRIRARAAQAAVAVAAAASNDDDKCCPLADLYQNADLVVTSPLTRCVQTALLSMEPILSSSTARKNPPPPVIAHEALRETVNFNCDRRRMIHEIVQDFTMPDNKQLQAKDDANADDPSASSALSFSIDFHSQITTPHDDLWEHYEQWLGTHEEYQHHRESAQTAVVIILFIFGSIRLGQLTNPTNWTSRWF